MPLSGVLFWRGHWPVRLPMLWGHPLHAVSQESQMRVLPHASSSIPQLHPPLCIITAGGNKCCDIRLFNPLSSEKCILSRINLLPLPVCLHFCCSTQTWNYFPVWYFLDVWMNDHSCFLFSCIFHAHLSLCIQCQATSCSMSKSGPGGSSACSRMSVRWSTRVSFKSNLWENRTNNHVTPKLAAVWPNLWKLGSENSALKKLVCNTADAVWKKCFALSKLLFQHFKTFLWTHAHLFPGHHLQGLNQGTQMNTVREQWQIWNSENVWAQHCNKGVAVLRKEDLIIISCLQRLESVFSPSKLFASLQIFFTVLQNLYFTVC